MISLISMIFAISIAGGNAYDEMNRIGFGFDTHTEPYVTVTTISRPQWGITFTKTMTITPTTGVGEKSEAGFWGFASTLVDGMNILSALSVATMAGFSSVYDIPVFGPFVILFWISTIVLFVLRTVVWGGD